MAKTTKRHVIIRARDAGVHCGTLKSVEGRHVVLTEASRIWRWRGANTLNELALRGPDRDSYTRISEAVPRVEILDACEILDVVADHERFAPIWLG